MTDEESNVNLSTEDEHNDKKESSTHIANITQITCQQDLTPLFEKSDHSINKIHLSEVPQICQEEPCQLGVDEAGRGPVLGPMVYGIAYAPLSKKELLIDLGCADSKSLTEEQRDAIFDKICNESDKMGWAVEAISPNVIANSMYRRCKTSLNEVSMNSAIGLIHKAIEAGVNIAEVYVDTVGKPEKYQAKLQEIFPEFKIVVAKKADSTYPIVSAASICAKVSRDHALRAWQFREGSNENQFGSGYPNDPVTKKWLTSNVDQVFGFPHIVRFSWSTAEKILESSALAVEWEDLEEEQLPTEQKISKYFAKVDTRTKAPKLTKHSFFTERHLSSTNDL
ncbi:ribonuclease H2 subunit A [Cephus cinctus]|uniref:Ribonuclease n=1 Tax=Cephus cinctus TaxID=211228 RepID=A0AAJ7CD82_CEPCN|nr:ribonuclease H2 subunit A [Cephus cinctus]